MAHYAHVVNGIVQSVIVAESDFIDRYPPTEGYYVQASYNTKNGVHVLGGTPLRKNYPGPGWIYDDYRDAFIPPRPFDTWVLDEDTGQWQAPVPHPQDGKIYRWNPYSNQWIEWGCDGVPQEST